MLRAKIKLNPMKRKGKKKTWELVRHSQRWTPKEEDLLRELYPAQFNHDLEERFERTVSAISGKASKLGIRKNWRKYDPSRIYIHKPWEKQKDILIKLYPTTSNKELARLFGRTINAIIHQAALLGLRKAYYILRKRNKTDIKFWTQEEDALIRRLYPTTWTKDLAAQLDRTTQSVAKRATHLGVRKYPEKYLPPPKFQTWSDEDIKKLKKLWQQGYTKTQIAEIIGIAVISVKAQLRKQLRHCGLQRRYKLESWQKKDDDYLIRYFHKKSSRQISDILGRTINAVRSRAAFLNLTHAKGPSWTQEDVSILEKYYTFWTNKKIAKQLGRTLLAVERKAFKLGLRKRDK